MRIVVKVWGAEWRHNSLTPEAVEPGNKKSRVFLQSNDQRSSSPKEGLMRKHGVFVTTFAVLFALSATRVAQAWAQNGVISFWEVCSWTAYVMRGEAESASNPRVTLLPGGVNGPQFFPLDVSTTGPVTVLFCTASSLSR
jgi:hypothetical protein